MIEYNRDALSGRLDFKRMSVRWYCIVLKPVLASNQAQQPLWQQSNGFTATFPANGANATSASTFVSEASFTNVFSNTDTTGEAPLRLPCVICGSNRDLTSQLCVILIRKNTLFNAVRWNKPVYRVYKM